LSIRPQQLAAAEPGAEATAFNIRYDQCH
jgi:hypothetical protein